MKTKRRTFSKVIRKYILWCLGLTLFIYTIILNFYLINGTWMAASFELEIFGRQYERLLAKDPNTPLPNSFNIKTYLNYSDIPPKIREYLPQEKMDVGILHDVDFDEIEDSDDIRLDLFYMVLPYQLKDGGILYIIQDFNSEDEDSVFFEEMDQYSFVTLPIAGGFLLIFIVIVAVLGRRLAKPSQDLAIWAKGISSETLDQPIPDFKFVELNEVASELHNSLVRVDKFVKREREFLRQASHELRTPVTVISGNIELLTKHNIPDSQNRILGRINRASKNMKQLIETLLWLGREIGPELKKDHVDYYNLISEVLAELEYLSDSENVKCSLTIERTDPIFVSETALYIVVSNLIRNAFQHTPRGTVKVHLEGQILTIENHLDVQSAHPTEKQGIGVGLNLVQKICKRCGWFCETDPLENGGMRATLDLKM